MEKEKRKALLEAYKQVKVYMGVYQLRNAVNGKLFIGSAPNLKSRELTLRMQLNEGKHMSAALQQEWKQYGPDAFAYEVLEQVEVKEDTDVKHELRALEAAWKRALQPYGEKGYHTQE